MEHAVRNFVNGSVTTCGDYEFASGSYLLTSLVGGSIWPLGSDKLSVNALSAKGRNATLEQMAVA
jgi:hypothetical protein